MARAQQAGSTGSVSSTGGGSLPMTAFKKPKKTKPIVIKGKRKKTQKEIDADLERERNEKPTWFPVLMAYIQYTGILLYFLYLRLTDRSKRKGYGRLISWDKYYSVEFIKRLQDVFSRPITSNPGAHIDVCERYSTDYNKTIHIREGVTRKCINLGSYNYLGFGDDWMTTCSDVVLPVVQKHPVAVSTALNDYGTTPVHQELETLVADYLGKESAMLFNMGYGTNAMTIPALGGKGTLFISDSLNHASIVNGARVSGSTVRVFKHNDASHLEEVLRDAIAHGQPRRFRPWTKIIIIIEGIYSMEGEIVNLREIVDVAKKYKAYTYVDEAHSIGALGKTGRGVCEYTGVDPSEIDILMGTFTKSFAANGGYIAASKQVIDHLKVYNAGAMYSPYLSPVVAAQIIAAMRVILGRDGTDLGQKKLKALRDNSNYFRKRVSEMGLQTLGNEDSPVIPVLLYVPHKILTFSRECFERNIAVVTVGYPATPLLLSRVRFCISAGHTIEDLEEALVQIEEIAKVTRIRYVTRTFG